MLFPSAILMQTSNILPNVYYKEMVDQFFVSSNNYISGMKSYHIK